MSLGIGVICSFPSCGEIDFLPILCHCKKHFCRHHASPDSHSCSSNLPFSHPSAKGDISCSVSGCKRPCTASSQVEQVLMTCMTCSRSYCVIHRRTSCQCPNQPRSTSNIENARALLAKNFPRRTLQHQARDRRVDMLQMEPMDKVSLMRMRRNALPGDPSCNVSSVRLDDRTYVRVRVSSETASMFWFSKNSITGKVLDLLELRLNIRVSDGNRNYLVLVDDVTVPPSRKILRNDLPIAQQVCDNSLLVIDTCKDT